MKFTTKHGFFGLSVEQKEFMVEGINEKGLSAGLFYFPLIPQHYYKIFFLST